MFDRAELEKIVLGRYKFTGFGWVPYPRRVPRAGPDCREPGPDQFFTRGYENLRRNRARSKPLGWPVSGHSLIEVERHLRRFLICDLTPLIEDQVDTYISAIRHNQANASAEMREACAAFEIVWAKIEDSNPLCPACLKRSRKRANRLSKGLA